MSSSDRLCAAALLVVAVASGANGATLDLAALEVVPQRGQSPDRARRDRYECHNWAVEQTGVIPPSGRYEDDEHEVRAVRAERVARVLNGASIGAAIGGLIRAVQDRDPSNGVLAGAAVGAAVGATTGRASRRHELDEDSQQYLRALSACLEGRGYTVSVPGEADAETAAAIAAAR